MAAIQIEDRYCFHSLYIQELEKGDTATANHFLAYFRPRLRSLLRKNGAPPDSVEDLQQETVMRVLIALRAKGIRHPERLGSFVNAVCKNTLLESRRKSKRYVECDDSMHELPDVGLNPDAVLMAQEAAALVRRVLARLSSRDQKLLRDLLIEQRSKSEICKELGVSSGNLRVLLYRAKRQFVNRMGNELRHFQIAPKYRTPIDIAAPPPQELGNFTEKLPCSSMAVSANSSGFLTTTATASS